MHVWQGAKAPGGLWTPDSRVARQALTQIFVIWLSIKWNLWTGCWSARITQWAPSQKLSYLWNMYVLLSFHSIFISPVVSALICSSARRASPYMVICIRYQALQPLQLSVVIDKWTVICNGDKTQLDNYRSYGRQLLSLLFLRRLDLSCLRLVEITKHFCSSDNKFIPG